MRGKKFSEGLRVVDMPEEEFPPGLDEESETTGILSGDGDDIVDGDPDLIKELDFDH